MCASMSGYKRPDKWTDWVVLSYDGYSVYLIIVNGTSQCIQAFLTQTKDHPVDIVQAFMTKFGIGSGLVCTDQGGELTRRNKFCTILQSGFQYIVEPTGSDSPSQNGAAEIDNDKLTVKTHTLLYGSGL